MPTIRALKTVWRPSGEVLTSNTLPWPRTTTGIALPLERTRINSAIDLEHRQKGLLWYSTYKIAFRGDYTFHNKSEQEQEVSFILPLPSEKAVYDGLQLEVDGKPVESTVDGKSATAKARVTGNAVVTLHVAFKSQGLDRWRYNFGRCCGVNDFELQITTNFPDIDFSEDALAPTFKKRTSQGWDLTWKYSSLVSGFNISVDMPAKLQPGQLAGEISFFAARLSLLFLFPDVDDHNPPRNRPASDELFLSCGILFRLPSPAGVSRGSHRHTHCLLRLLRVSIGLVVSYCGS